jgi:hypothetical protein
MNPSRKSKREDLEVTLLYKSRQENMLVADLIDEKLTQLQMFIGQLTHTPHGRAELETRIKRFGECKRIEGESSAQFYGRLRHWLDRDFQTTKSIRYGSGQSSMQLEKGD